MKRTVYEQLREVVDNVMSSPSEKSSFHIPVQIDCKDSKPYEMISLVKHLENLGKVNHISQATAAEDNSGKRVFESAASAKQK